MGSFLVDRKHGNFLAFEFSQIPQIKVNGDGVKLRRILHFFAHQFDAVNGSGTNFAFPNGINSSLIRFEKRIQFFGIFQNAEKTQNLRHTIVRKHCDLRNVVKFAIRFSQKRAPHVGHENLRPFEKINPSILKFAKIAKRGKILTKKLKM
jgi:hypothetical protein